MPRPPPVRVVAALPQLGDFKLQRADPGVQVAFPVAAGMGAHAWLRPLDGEGAVGQRRRRQTVLTEQAQALRGVLGAKIAIGKSCRSGGQGAGRAGLPPCPRSKNPRHRCLVGRIGLVLRWRPLAAPEEHGGCPQRGWPAMRPDAAAHRRHGGRPGGARSGCAARSRDSSGHQLRSGYHGCSARDTARRGIHRQKSGGPTPGSEPPRRPQWR
jgi:hypothetical protein